MPVHSRAPKLVIRPPRQPLRSRRTVVVSACLAGCCTTVAIIAFVLSSTSATRLRRPARRAIIPEFDQSRGMMIRRSVLSCPRGLCVVQHFPPSRISIANFANYQHGDFGEIAFEPYNPWFAGQDQGLCETTFNCCAFAVSHVVALQTGDWIAPVPTWDGLPTPIAVLVDSYFDPVCELDRARFLDRRSFEHDPRIRDGDVVGFEVEPAPTDRSRRVFTHVGRVRKRDGINRLLSKFGPGPVILSDLNFADRLYPGGTKAVIYRARTDGEAPMAGG